MAINSFDSLLRSKELGVSLKFSAEYIDAAQWVVTRNPNDYPYHSTLHLVGAAECAYQIFEAWRIPFENASGDEASTQIRQVVVYAMMGHDYKYAGSWDDSVNINTTIAALAADGFYKDLGIEHLQSRIENAIRYTQYPYVNTPDPYEYREHLICEMVRDADQLYSIVHMSEGVMRGLFEEWAPRENITDYGEWILRNIDFVYRKRFNLDATQELAAKAMPDCVRTHFELYAANAEAKLI